MRMPPSRPEHRPRLPDLVLWAVCTGVLTAELAGLRPAPVPEAAAMALLLAAAFTIGRAWPFAALGLATGAAVLHAAAIALGLTTVFAMGYALPCAVLAFLAGRRSERTAPAIALILAAALSLLALRAAEGIRGGEAREALTGLADWGTGVLALVACVLAPWLLGRYWRRHAEIGSAGWEIADRMERARDLDAERARLRERARIATEMHDSLGHDLALIAVRAAALEMAADGGDQRTAAAELRTTAHDAAQRLRAIIGVLREEAGPTAVESAAEDVAALVERAAGAGMPVRLLREGTGPDSAGAAGRAVHRIVQEALTNAARHAPGARVTVRLVRADDGATDVHVGDTGPVGGTTGGDTAGNGSGLAGLRALVRGMGGTFDAGPDGAGGFAVRASIPREDAADGAGADAAAPEDPPTAEGPHTATEAALRLRRLRSGSRRRLAAALALPLGLAGAITALVLLLLWTVSMHTVLPRADYEGLRAGERRDAVERVLPVFDHRPGPIPGEPPAPPGSRCEYYLVTADQGLHPVYRLCFADGRLAAKHEIAREQAGAGR